jgi:hypothetical protein
MLFTNVCTTKAWRLTIKFHCEIKIFWNNSKFFSKSTLVLQKKKIDYFAFVCIKSLVSIRFFEPILCMMAPLELLLNFRYKASFGLKFPIHLPHLNLLPLNHLHLKH